jgi:uncharacterized membrane protein
MTVDIYGWVKAFHIVAVIAWMAGMLYLPRLFVYHCAAEKGSVQSAGFTAGGHFSRLLQRAVDACDLHDRRTRLSGNEVVGRA